MNVPAGHMSAPASSAAAVDYHDVEDGHWIDDHVSTPMARYPEYRQSRRFFGINVLGTLVVEVEADNGTTGFALTTAGEPGAFIVEKHLARFVEGRPITDIERAWDQMYFSTQYYGCRGDRGERDLGRGPGPLGPAGQVARGAGPAARWPRAGRNSVFYATGARPDIAQQLGFTGGKMPLQHGPAEGEEGLKKNLAKLEDMRNKVGEDFWLMFDCWMSLDLNYATRARSRGAPVRPEPAKGMPLTRRLLGLRRAAQERASRHAGHDRRARGDALGLPHAAGDGLLRHHPARRTGAAASPS